MKWFKKTRPKSGDLRIKRKFLWLPLCLDNEYRWLCWTRIIQKYQIYDVEEIIVYSVREYTIGRWDNIHWTPDTLKSDYTVYVDGESPK